PQAPLPPANGTPTPPAPPVETPQARKAALVARLRPMKAAGMNMQAIATQLNTEGVPTISGRGQWQKGTVANLLAQAEASPC
ncbi:MAG: recombinase family protein, partial [Candidatus Limnocylindria bacterium]